LTIWQRFLDGKEWVNPALENNAPKAAAAVMEGAVWPSIASFWCRQDRLAHLIDAG
jgi:hypothetical protein